jgi:hypothetical protein
MYEEGKNKNNRLNHVQMKNVWGGYFDEKNRGLKIS